MQILQLLNLRYLNLSYQGLVHIPDSISLLSSLQHLVVSYNPHLLNIAAEAGSLPLMCKWYQDDKSAPGYVFDSCSNLSVSAVWDTVNMIHLAVYSTWYSLFSAESSLC